MKKPILTIFLFSFLISHFSFLISPAAAVSATDSAKEAQSKELLQKLATRTAELRAGMRKSLHGEIKSTTSDGKIILTTKTAEKTINTDDSTIFFRISLLGRKEIKFSSLVTGEQISVFGLAQEITGEFTAKVVVAKILPVNLIGKVSDIDLENGTLTILTLKQGTFIIDVETATKIYTANKVKLGFSKIKPGDRVFINGISPTKPKAGENRLTANRILVIPLILATPTASTSATPSAQPKAIP